MIFYIVGKNVSLLPFLYFNNYSLDSKTNNEIKQLLLDVVKDKHSTIYKMDKNVLYTDEYVLKYIQYDDSWIAKSVFISIDSNFMKHTKKINNKKYTAELQMNFPDDWHYYFDIVINDDKFIISYLEIDP